LPFSKDYLASSRSLLSILGSTASAPINVTNISGAKKERKDLEFMYR
jgi:hypothetical protein